MLFTTPDGSAVDITCNTWKCARIPKVASKSQVRGQPRWLRWYYWNPISVW